MLVVVVVLLSLALKLVEQYEQVELFRRRGHRIAGQRGCPAGVHRLSERTEHGPGRYGEGATRISFCARRQDFGTHNQSRVHPRMPAGSGKAAVPDDRNQDRTSRDTTTRERIRHLLADLGRPYLVLRLGVHDPAEPAAPQAPRLPTGQLTERT